VVPHYWLAISMAVDTIGMGLRPRYRGAERDHPIVINSVFAFPDTPTGQEAAQQRLQAQESSLNQGRVTESERSPDPTALELGA
jgi:hypothetical protein